MTWAALAAPAIGEITKKAINGGGDNGIYQQSLLSPAQQQLQKSQIGAANGTTQSGAFGEAANYYRGLLSDQSKDFDAFAAPELRRFNEQIIPDLAEQFAGMGSGALSSSGFRNSAVNAGADLSERLGAIRAQLRAQGAQGLMDLGTGALKQTNENLYNEPQASGWDNIAEGVGKSIPSLVSAGVDYFKNKPANSDSGGLGPSAIDSQTKYLGVRG